MKKNISFAVVFLMISCLGISAQVQIADTSIVQSLERITGTARVRLFQDSRLTDRLARNAGNSASFGTPSHMTVRGYRIQVFSDNNQRHSKDEAYQKASVIKNLFPDMSTYVTFTSPFWRLRVGDFRSYEEANAKLVELKEAFPRFREMRIVKDMIRLGRTAE